ncbi:MAG: hypothetical protein ACYC3L_01315 [Gemmatimonadaceae bacterium]
MKTAQEKVHTVAETINRRLGIALDFDDAWTLRRAALTLHRWHEEECNGTIQRDEEIGSMTEGRPFRWIDGMGYGAPIRSSCPIPDREKGALARIADVCARNGLAFYVQTDQRGAPLYVARPGDGMTDSNHPSVGVRISAD